MQEASERHPVFRPHHVALGLYRRSGDGGSLTWSSEFHPDQPGHGSLYFDGQQSSTLVGAYWTTAAGAPLNTETFAGGYTFEVFVQVPTDWNSNSNSWMAALSRGWIGDVRIVNRPNRPLSVGEFMIAGQ